MMNIPVATTRISLPHKTSESFEVIRTTGPTIGTINPEKKNIAVLKNSVGIYARKCEI
jgi:hypothetical protein